MDHPPLQVKVVSADREVWKGVGQYHCSDYRG